ncbi:MULTISPECIES: hypothetical protein [unclassified Phaeobacter]|uniref:hypothetical protein n=1 Tax=unclassified Phaeobacter TaxID=2621772 RepID=UPI003A84450B
MYEYLASEFIQPLLRRVGTAFGTYLVTIGVTQETSNMIVAGIIALGGVLVDLALSHSARIRNSTPKHLR